MRNKRRILLFVVFCVCWCMGNQVFAQTDGKVEERINRAIGLGLQEWIDEEGYHTELIADSVLADRRSDFVAYEDRQWFVHQLARSGFD